MSREAVNAARAVFIKFRDECDALPADASHMEWMAAHGKSIGAFEAWAAASVAECESIDAQNRAKWDKLAMQAEERAS